MGGWRSSHATRPPHHPGGERAGDLAAARNLNQKKRIKLSPLTVSSIHV